MLVFLLALGLSLPPVARALNARRRWKEAQREVALSLLRARMEEHWLRQGMDGRTVMLSGEELRRAWAQGR